MKRYSTGDMQRALAAEMGITSLELNRRAEADPEIDRLIDSKTLELASSGDPIVFDSRLAWHFVPDSFKVFLTVDRKLGAERIYKAGRGSVEQYESLDEALTQVQERRDSEDRRYIELYQINPELLDNYHIVVDTSDIEPARVARQIAAGYENWLARTAFPTVWLSPRTPLPTCDVDALDAERVRAIRDSVEGVEHPAIPPVELLRVDRHYYVHLGHHAVSACIDAGTGIIPAVVRFSEGDITPMGVSAARFVETGCRMSRIRAWEEAHSFHFPSYPSSCSD